MFEISLGNDLPVPLNLCPLPMSILNFFRRVNQMIFLKTSSSNEEKNNSNKIKADNSLHMNIGRIINTVNNQSRRSSASSVTNEKNPGRKRSSVLLNGKLTYKIVIERIVKRFLLYYSNRHGLTNSKEQLQFREVKNDIASFRFEVSYQVDQLDELADALAQSMDQFNGDLKKSFDIEHIKKHQQFKSAIPSHDDTHIKS